MVFGELVLNNEKYHFQFEDYELQIHRFETDNSDCEDIEDLLSFKTIKVPDSRRVIVYNMSVEEALTRPVKPNAGLICYDHLGGKFYSITTMCQHWGVARKVYMYRVSHGWSIEKALTTPSRQSKKKKPADC